MPAQTIKLKKSLDYPIVHNIFKVRFRDLSRIRMPAVSLMSQKLLTSSVQIILQ